MRGADSDAREPCRALFQARPILATPGQTGAAAARLDIVASNDGERQMSVLLLPWVYLHHGTGLAQRRGSANADR